MVPGSDLRSTPKYVPVICNVTSEYFMMILKANLSNERTVNLMTKFKLKKNHYELFPGALEVNLNDHFLVIVLCDSSLIVSDRFGFPFGIFKLYLTDIY